MGMTVIEQDTMHAIQSACRKYTNSKKEIDWEQRRYEIAKDMFVRMSITDYGYHYSATSVKDAVDMADALIEELKKKGE